MVARYAHDDPIPNAVVPGVYIGSVGAAVSWDALSRAGITHMLSCADGLVP